MAGTDKFITIDGVRLHYTEHGDPASPPLLCLHGFTGDAHNWDTFASRISDRYHVFALTARGHGDSDRAASYEDQFQPVNDAAGFMDALGVAPAIVIGHSMGASIGGGLAVLHPAKVLKLVLGDGGPDMDPEGAAQIHAMICEWPDEFDTVDEAAAFLRSHWGGLREDELAQWTPYGVSRDSDGKFRLKLDPALVRARVERGPDVLPPGESPMWQFIPQIKCPTLIVRGTRTTILPRACAERMLELMPDAQLVEMDSGHLLHLENPDGFYEAVREFI